MAIHSNEIKKGQLLTGGNVIGYVKENDLFYEHKIMLPPKAKGRVEQIQPEGSYNVNTPIIEIEQDGKIRKYSMSHFWPVRQARPVAEKQPRNRTVINRSKSFRRIIFIGIRRHMHNTRRVWM